MPRKKKFVERMRPEEFPTNEVLEAALKKNLPVAHNIGDAFGRSVVFVATPDGVTYGNQFEVSEDTDADITTWPMKLSYGWFAWTTSNENGCSGTFVTKDKKVIANAKRIVRGLQSNHRAAN